MNPIIEDTWIPVVSRFHLPIITQYRSAISSFRHKIARNLTARTVWRVANWHAEQAPAERSALSVVITLSSQSIVSIRRGEDGGLKRKATHPAHLVLKILVDSHAQPRMR